MRKVCPLSNSHKQTTHLEREITGGGGGGGGGSIFKARDNGRTNQKIIDSPHCHVSTRFLLLIVISAFLAVLESRNHIDV